MAACSREGVILFILGLAVGSFMTFSIYMSRPNVHDVASSKQVIEHLRSGDTNVLATWSLGFRPG